MTEWAASPGSTRAMRAVGRTSSRAAGRSSGVLSLWRIDWVLAIAALALSALGALLIWSATRGRLVEAGGDPQAFLKKHLLNVAIGMVLAIGAALIDYRSLRAYTPLLYVASLLGLVAVLSRLGSVINGARSWIVLPAGFQIQPSEFAKVSLVVGIALILGERGGDDAPSGRDVLAVLGVLALPLGLVALQPDFGTMMVFLVLVFGALAMSGVRRRYVVGLAVAGVVAMVLALNIGLLQQYQVDRLTSFYRPDQALSGPGYQVNQAKIAIGSGGMFGQGLFNGTQTSGGFVPEQQTDFVFSVAGEELGFAGASALLVVLGLVLWRGVRIAQRASDSFGTLIAVGVVSWFAFQSFVNIGMTLGLMPLTGLPLPFVSYGGSSMFANMLAVGLLQNVHLRSTSDR